MERGKHVVFYTNNKSEYRPHFPLKLSSNTDRAEEEKLLLHDYMSMERE